MCSLCSWNFVLAKNECWNKILCFSLSNLSNIPSSTGLQGASTTWTSFALLAENCRRSVGHWAADIPDNVDYWSNFFEVVEIHRRTAQTLITQFKVQFARHGIPEVLISNNGPNLTTRNSRISPQIGSSSTKTLGPRYPQVNGKVENAVKTCKGLLLKAKEDKRDSSLAILSWRNTPSEGLSTSPVQRLMGRRTHTLLPTAEKLLQLNSNLKTTARSLAARKNITVQAVLQYFIPLKVGEAIRMKLPGEQKWSLGCCSCLLDWRSYEVQVDGRCFHRNHPQLSSTLKPSPVPSSNNEEPHQTENESRSPFCQSLYQTSAKPHWLVGFGRITHCSQHTLSQTAQNQSQFSYLDALVELKYHHLAQGLWLVLNT